jgi:hypothetical protein
LLVLPKKLLEHPVAGLFRSGLAVSWLHLSDNDSVVEIADAVSVDVCFESSDEDSLEFVHVSEALNLFILLREFLG